MPAHLSNLYARNFRTLLEVSFDLPAIGVIFGPNGVGKTTLLDSIWYFRDCVVHGVGDALASRNGGFELFSANQFDGPSMEVGLSDGKISYKLTFGVVRGMVHHMPGESLSSASGPSSTVIWRRVSTDTVQFYPNNPTMQLEKTLLEPDRTSLANFLDHDFGWEETREEVLSFRSTIHSIRYLRQPWINHSTLRQVGSDTGSELLLNSDGSNLWSVLRNMKEQRSRLLAYEAILRFMREAFPTFQDMEFQQTGPSKVYVRFNQSSVVNQISALYISDGELHMLLVLTALFSGQNGTDQGSLIMLDEPDASLHPHAQVVLAKAIRHAEKEFNRQVLVATHSPSLIGEFEKEELFVMGELDGLTSLTQLSKIDEVAHLIDHYDAGTLYMSEVIAPQAKGLSADAQGLTPS